MKSTWKNVLLGLCSNFRKVNQVEPPKLLKKSVEIQASILKKKKALKLCKGQSFQIFNSNHLTCNNVMYLTHKIIGTYIN